VSELPHQVRAFWLPAPLGSGPVLRVRQRSGGAALSRGETLPDLRRTGEHISGVVAAVRAEPDPRVIRVATQTDGGRGA